MALTDTLDTPNSQSRVFAPVAAPSALGSLAELAGGLFAAQKQRATLGAESAYAARQATKDANEAGKTAAENSVALRAAELMAGPQQSQLPDGTVTNVKRLVTMQKAVEAGSLPAAMAQIKTENFVLDVMHQNPGHEAEVFAYAKAQGLDHVAFRAYQEAEQTHNAQIASHQSAEDDLIKLAVSHGAHPDMPRSQLIELGRAQSESAYATSLLKSTLEAKQANQTYTEAERKAAEPQTLDAAWSAISTSDNADLNLFMANVNNFVSAANQGMGNPTELDGMQAGIFRDMNVAIEAKRQDHYRLIDGSGLSFEAKSTLKDRVDKQYQTYKDFANLTLTGPQSVASTNLRAFQNFQAVTGLNAMQAMPIYSGLYKAMGPNFLNSFGPTAPQMSDKMKKAFVREVSQVNINNPDGSNGAHFNNMVGILTGTKEITEVAAADIPGTLAVVGHNFNTVGPKIAAGTEKDQGVIDQFVRGAAALYTTAGRTGPMAPSLGASAFISTSYSQSAANGLIKAIGSGNAEARDVLENGRGSAQAMLQNLSKGAALEALHQESGWKIAFNDKTSKWEATGDQKIIGQNQAMGAMALNAGAGTGGPTFIDMSHYLSQQVTVPEDVKLRLRDLNTLTGFISYTRNNADDAPKAATQRSYAAWVASGGKTPLVDNKGNMIDMGSGKTSKDNLTTIAETIHRQAADIVSGNASEATGTASKAVSNAVVSQLDPVEALALTIAGEASADSREMTAVGHTVMNRLNSGKYGKDLADVLDPGQFEAWTKPGALLKLRGSKKYQDAMALAERLIRGDQEGNDGFTHFYAPAAQASLGRNAPKWDNGKGVDIGQTRFFR